MKKLCSIFLVLTLLLSVLPISVPALEVAQDTILVDEDFSEGFTLNQAYTGAEMEALSDLNFVTGMPNAYWPDNVNAYFTVKQMDENDSSKGNYLEIKSPKSESHAVVMADFDDVTKGTIVTEMKVRTTTLARPRNYNGLIGADGSEKNTVFTTSNEDIIWSGGIFPNWQIKFSEDEKGFSSLRAIWYREEATDNWSIDLYDMISNKKVLSYTGIGTDKTVDSSFVPSGAMFFSLWQVTADENFAADLAALKVYIPSDVTISVDGEYDFAKKTISLETSKDLDATTVNGSTVKVTDDSNKEVSAIASYDNGIITVQTNDILAEGNYTVSLNGAKTAEGYAIYNAEDSFYVGKAGQVVLVNEDFSKGFTLNQTYTGAQMEALSDLNFVTGVPSGYYADTVNSYLTVKAIDENDSSKGNYLEIGDHADGKHALVMGDFEDVTKGTLVTEMKIRVHEGFRTKYFNGLIGTDQTLKHTGYSTGDDVWSGGLFPTWNKTFTKDTDGFVSIKAVWYRANTTDNWSIDLYDMVLGQKVLSYTGEGTDQTVDRGFVPSGAIFVSAYKDPTWSDVAIDIASLKAYIPAEVTLEEKDEYNTSTNSVSFSVSEALVPSTVTKQTVVMKDSSGETVDITPTYADGVLTVTTTSRITKGEYTVTLNGVKAVSTGFELNGVSCTIVANVTGDIILVNEDFSKGFTLNQAYTGAQMEALSDLNFVTNLPANYWPDKDNAYFKVKPIDAEDSSKGNYLEVGHHADDKHALIMGDFEDITKGTLVTEMKVRVHEGFITKNFNGLIGTDQTVKYTGYSTGDDVWSGGLFPTWNKTFTKDTDGFVSIKAVWYRANTTDNWSIDLYDMVLGQKILSYTGEGTDQTVDSSFVPTGAMFFSSWQVAANANAPMDFAALKVYIPADISLEKDGEYNFAKNSISFKPSAELVASTVNSQTVTLKDENGTDVAITTSYANGAITVKTSKRLTNGTYTVTVNGATSAIDGRTLNNVTCSFTINVTGNIVLVDEDFSKGFAVGTTYTGAQMEALSDLEFTTDGFKDTYPDKTSAYLTVKAIDAEDSSKGNYLEIGDHLDGKSALVAADFEDVTEGTLVTEMKIRSYGNETKHRPKNYNGLLNAEGDWKSTAYGSDMGSDATKVWSGGIFPKWSITFTKDTDGFNHVKAVWYRAKATDNWSVDLYDMVRDVKVLSYTGAGDQTIDSTFVPSGAIFLNAYKDTTWADEVIDIAALKAYIVPVNQNYAVENIVCTSADAEIEAITSSMTEVAVKADVYTKTANEAFTAVLAIYNGERLAGVQTFDGVSNNAGVQEVSLELTGLDLIDGATVKVFLWDGITSMKPLLGATEVLPKAGF